MNLEIIGKIFKIFLTFRLRRIEQLKANPVSSQERLLNKIIKTAESTEFGKNHDFISIKSLKDFQQKVPVSVYEDLFPYIEKMMGGERDVLWPGLVANFSKSSGTTARSKFIPVSKELLRSYFKAGKDEMALYLKNNPNSKMLQGKSIVVGGSFEKIKTSPDMYCGDISGILMKDLPSIGSYFRVPSLEVATLSDYEIKLEKMAEETMTKDITNFAGTPTWTIALIKKVLEKTNAKNILEVWPNLEIFFHGAVSFLPYRKIFEELIPSSDMHYMETYNASEGFFAIQDDLSLPEEMLLLPDHGVFYEFIQMSEYGKEDATVYTMDDVELGKNYALIISTNAGLWRYSIGDTVAFTSLFPHRIKITGRTKHFINAFGEEVLVHNTDTAIKEACLKTGSSIVDYTACPLFMGNGTSGGHEWIVEFDNPPQFTEQFANFLDEALRRINSDYDAKRHKDIILHRLTLHSVPKGTFYKWMKNRGKLGGQNKVPRLSNSREYVEELLKLL